MTLPFMKSACFDSRFDLMLPEVICDHYAAFLSFLLVSNDRRDLLVCNVCVVI